MNTFTFLLEQQYQFNIEAMLRSVFTVQAIQIAVKLLERVRFWIDKKNPIYLTQLNLNENYTHKHTLTSTNLYIQLVHTPPQRFPSSWKSSQKKKQTRNISEK